MLRLLPNKFQDVPPEIAKYFRTPYPLRTDQIPKNIKLYESGGNHRNYFSEYSQIFIEDL